MLQNLDKSCSPKSTSIRSVYNTSSTSTKCSLLPINRDILTRLRCFGTEFASLYGSQGGFCAICGSAMLMKTRRDRNKSRITISTTIFPGCIRRYEVLRRRANDDKTENGCTMNGILIGLVIAWLVYGKCKLLNIYTWHILEGFYS